jgi:hypothetical protein
MDDVEQSIFWSWTLLYWTFCLSVFNAIMIAYAIYQIEKLSGSHNKGYMKETKRTAERNGDRIRLEENVSEHYPEPEYIKEKQAPTVEIISTPFNLDKDNLKEYSTKEKSTIEQKIRNGDTVECLSGTKTFPLEYSSEVKASLWEGDPLSGRSKENLECPSMSKENNAEGYATRQNNFILVDNLDKTEPSDSLKTSKPSRGYCKISGCENLINRRKRCAKHFEQWKHANPELYNRMSNPTA